MDDIKVVVVKYPDRANLVMRYIDPMTGKQVARSTGTSKMADATKQAGKWEDDLREGRYKAPNKTTWEEFRRQYEDEVVAGFAKGTQAKATSVFNALEKHVNPKLVRDVTPKRLSYLQSKLRASGSAESTIAGYLAYLQAALRYAVDWGMLPTVPTIPRIQRAKVAKTMKGRPITTEEFERMLVKVEVGLARVATGTNKPKPVTKRRMGAAAVQRLHERRSERAAAVAERWRYFLRGLWLSGLRLAESLELYWDRDDRLCVDLSGRHPMLRIPAALEKGNLDRLLPISPEFAEFLLATPAADRHGAVFNPCTLDGSRAKEGWASRVICKIGAASGVKVRTDAKTAKVKYASAHDLRRSFGERWASRVMPQVLMQLMRHESMETTLRFYVGRNAESTAGVLWEAHRVAQGNSSGNNQPQTETAETGRRHNRK